MRAVPLLLALLLLAGCATQSQWPTPGAGPDLPESRLLAQVPFHAQARYQCGPAALAMMLNSQSLPHRPEELVDRVYLPKRGGTLQVEMVAAAREQGLIVYPLRQQTGAIIAEVAAGNPVLVMQNLRFSWWPQWHYAVVVGYDRPRRELILHTGTRRAHPQPLKVFRATWDRAERWAMVMLDPRQMPATVEPMPWLRAASDLEQSGQPRAAYQAYHSALQRWPDQPAALFGMGNSAAALGQYSLAVEHLLSFTRQNPQLAAGWNNLGQVLYRLDCPQAATVASGCAASLDARFAGSASTPRKTGRPMAACPVLSCP
ncbi:MAG: PA2778 family cysteine peptidase [Oleiphilaceae bacterium]|nr:PA2778 family cysteine peptidase [Oleiphilaceae bacterium]